MSDWSTCPKCGSPKIIPDAKVMDRDDNGREALSVWILRNPQARLFTDPEIVELRARICGSCGYTELYAAKPDLLWDAFQEASRRQPAD